MKTTTRFATFGASVIALNLAFYVALGLGAWWFYNHVLSPSFGWPRLGVH
jgi:hypothetical protein